MHKRLLLLFVALILCFGASAQFRYTFKDTTTAYTPLTGATSLNAGAIWVGRNYVAPMPFSWTMDSTINLSALPLLLILGSTCADTSNLSDASGFMFADLTELIDRGALGTVSKSPIRYTTTGAAPSRIFKLELFSAGFAFEDYMYNTLDDSANIQIWIYETSNIVELHYGPSRITYPADYFASASSAPLIGYFQHIDYNGGSAGELYYIKGTPGSTGIDSISITASNPPSNILSSWPASGKVFRFTPRSAPCATPTANFTAGTPSGKTVQYTYTGTTTGVDSLVWNFGDNQKLKVTTGFTMPISHTFANNGHYNVCVTAYNSCGNNVSCKPLALAIGDLAALGDVKVYPNPALSFITIKGMQAGSKVTVFSVVGQQIMSVDINSDKQDLNISALPAGTYRLMLSGNDGARGTVQMVKQ